MITISGEGKIDLLELIQNKSDFLFGTVSSKEGKNKGTTPAPSPMSKKGSRTWTRKEDQGRKQKRTKLQL